MCAARTRSAILLPTVMPSSRNEHSHPWGDAATPYEEIGGETRVRELAETFYDVIEESSPLLRDMLPTNTKNTREKFFMYMTGWLGGPPLYEQKWGHPRLRMRHSPFPIDDTAAAEWMRCMTKALDETGVPEPLRSFLIEKRDESAQHRRNQV